MEGPMDLNVAPSTDEDEDERQESAVDTMRRERAERMLRMKRQREEEGSEDKTTKISKPSFPTPAGKPNERLRSVGPIPEGWMDCPASGEPIAGLIPSKVPLGESFNEVIDAGKRYSRLHVVRHQRAVGREVAMVIDLTNTSRYYNANEWTNSGVKYVKVACRGRDEVPDNESVNTFVYEVLRFFHQQQAKGALAGNKYILVHCTHGHNRTGFMIVHFLMRTQCSTVDQAIQLFAQARPPGIYKQDYIDSLFTFYHEHRSQSLISPRTPEWKRPATVDLNGVASGDPDDDDDDDGGILAALQEEDPKPMTNDDVLGDAIPEEQQREMQSMCCWGLGVPQQGRGGGTLHFPGSQPVSLDRNNLQLLRQKYYYATWKADGTRYMMLVTRDGCYLIDRNFRFRRVQLRFPVKGIMSKETPAETQHLTLLDGEMVIDKLPDTGEFKRRYLVYDLMMLKGKPLVKAQFHERWKMIEKEVCEPRLQDAAALKNIYNSQMEPFSVRRKNFWMLSTTEKLLRQFIPGLPHEADGLIFQGWEDPYVPRTHEGLLKWKYAHMNSVDFVLKVSPTGTQYYLLLMEKGGKLKQLDHAKVIFPEGQDVGSMSGKVIECGYIRESETWSFMRIRYDKEKPNAYHVYLKVMASIKDNITDEVLMAEIEEIIKLPLYIERIGRDQQQGQHARRR